MSGLFGGLFGKGAVPPNQSAMTNDAIQNWAKYAAQLNNTVAPATPSKPVETVTSDQEIVAWRGWYLTDDLWLRSMTMRTIWDGPTLVADKTPEMGEVAGSFSAHGIYALKREQWDRSSYFGQCSVFGEVALSGVVLEGEHGYRAERAIIQRLILRVPTQLIRRNGDWSFLPPNEDDYRGDCWWLDEHPAIEVQALLEQRYECDVLCSDALENSKAWGAAFAHKLRLGLR